MDLLTPDTGYLFWSFIVISNIVLVAISLWMIFQSPNISSKLKLAFVIATVFIFFIGPFISIIQVHRHNKRIA